jgi:uncharacterized protein DUF6701/parallel beta helix pectate lyase-like protein
MKQLIITINKICLLITLFVFSHVVMALNFAVDNTGGFCVDHSASGGNFATLAAAMAAANTAGAPHTIDICPSGTAYIAQAGALNNANYAGLTIQGTTGVAANITVNPTGNNEVFHIQQPNITIQHLTTDNGGANGEGIEIQNGNNAIISNVNLVNSNRVGLFVNNSTGVTLSNVTVSNMGREGILANGGSTNLTINSADGSKPATAVDTTTRECIEIDSANVNINDVTVSNCNNIAIRIDGANAALDNIVVSNTNNMGIYLNGLAPLLNQDDTVNNTITITNTGREGIRSTNNADNAIIDNITVNTTGAAYECAEHQGDGDGVTVNFQNYNLSNCGREGLWMRSPDQVADNITVNTTNNNRECMEVDGADSIVTNLDLDNCSGIGLRIDGADVSATTIDINTTGNIGLRFDGARVTVNTADITNTTSYGLLVSGNDGTVNGVNISNVNNTGMRVENVGADIDNIDITDTRIHGLQITQNDADINTLELTNIGTYLAGNGGADGITTSNRRINLTNVTINDARDFGIHFNTTNNNHNGAKNFTNITIKDTGDDGIFINRSTNNLTMDTINISNSASIGLSLFLTRRATLSNLTIDGSAADGIQINRSRQNEIFDSTISNNGNRGIVLFTQNNNTTDEARNNIIHDNIISGNANFGLRILNNGSADNDNNQIYENCFNNPGGRNARDDETIGSPSANTFDVGGRGNFWDDDAFNSPGYSESCVDVAPANGICDVPYPIPTGPNSTDNSPLTSCAIVPGIDHYDIDFSPTVGITCEPISVTITAKDASNNTVSHSAATTINLSTNTNLGSWLSASVGTLTDATAGDGLADYQFPVSESTVTLSFGYPSLATPSGDTVNITITSTPNETSGIAPADTDPGDGTDDPNIVFRDAIFRVVDDSLVPVPLNISTKISGKRSNIAGTGFQNLYLQAIETVTATECTGTFENQTDVVVEFASECNDPTTCESVQVRVEDDDNNLISIPSNPDSTVTNYSATSGAGSIELDFDSDSKTPLDFVYDDAGQITLHARYDMDSPNGAYMSGSSNAFIVKPAGICVESTEPGSACPSADPTDMDCETPFKKAGETFNLTVKGVTWEIDADTDFCNTAGSGNVTTPNFEVADIELNSTVVEPSAGVNGALGITSIDIVNADKGSDTDSQTIDEVGVFTITASGDASSPTTAINYLSETIAPSTSVNIGRFTPDEFILSGAVLTNRIDRACSSASSFTYLNENIEVEYSLTAINALGSPTTTENYIDEFALLDVTADSMAMTPTTSELNYGGADLDAMSPTNLSGRLVEVLSSGTWSSGVAAITTEFVVSRAAGLDGPFDDFSVGIAPSDSDSITLDTGSYNLDVDDDATNDFLTVGSSDLFFGRVFIGTAVGSELLPLTAPFKAEYYNGSNFVTNNNDSCTRIDPTDLVLSNNIQGSETDASIEICTASGPVSNVTPATNLFSAGSGDLLFSAPGENCTGFSNIAVDLSALGLNFLQYDWSDVDGNDDGPYTENPSGRIDFGIFEGPSNYIYIREPW